MTNNLRNIFLMGAKTGAKEVRHTVSRQHMTLVFFLEQNVLFIDKHINTVYKTN